MTICRAAAYLWAGPNTLVGLGIAALTQVTGGRVSRVEGVVEVTGGAAAWLLRNAVPLPGGAMALTLGHVVLARDEDAAARTRRHERVHVAQYERWGPAFVPAYALASVLAYLRGHHGYRDNRFERPAFGVERKET